ncbi:AraC family transcriptional regulator [Bacillus sp. Gen3]|nr:AraC family transcriptional regulator [Bacillus sp. Gen3]
MNTIEQKLQILDYTFNSYIKTASFENNIQQPLTEKQFDIYRSIDKQLNYISSFGPNQTTAEFVSVKGNWVINKYGLRPLEKSQRDFVTSEYLTLPNSSTWVKEETAQDEIKLIKLAPLYKTNKNGVLIINIPMVSLTNLIYKQAESNPIYIYNKDGTLIYQSNKEVKKSKSTKDVFNEIRKDNSQTGIKEMNSVDGKYKFAYSKSPYNGWVYYTEINKADIATAMKPTIISIFIMSVSMLILTCIIAYLCSDYFSKPLRDLLMFFPKGQKGVYKDEFELIGQSFRKVIDHNQLLNDIVTSQAEKLKTLFMLNLFRGRISEMEVKEKLQDFKYPTNWCHFFVLTIQIDGLDQSKYTKKDEDVLLFAINKIVSEMVPAEERLTPTVIDSNVQATILLCPDIDSNQWIPTINQHAESIQNRVKDEFNLSISIGISSPYQKLTECHQALEQGMDALKYRLKVGKGSIVFYDSIAAIYNNKIRTFFPKKLENQLFDVIKKGDNEKSIEILHLLLLELFNSKNPHELEVNIMRFINDLMGLMQILGMETIILEDHKTLYGAISKMRTSEEIELFVKNKIMSPMIQTIKERTNSQYKTISDEIVHIIQKEFDTDLTLEKIAMRLHYNPNYLSSIFKKEFNQSFSEYLALYRYNMAKKWLLETNLPVKEIAEKLQYKNSQNFIRSFRKYEGTTPGKFREQHRFDSISF